MSKCEICRSDLVFTDSDWAVAGRECPRCGQFRIDTVSGNLRADQEWFSEDDAEKMVRLSGWVREQNRAGVVPTLTEEIVNRVIARPRPDLRSRSMVVLEMLVLEMEGATGDSPFIVDQTIHEPKILGCSYSATPNEVRMLLRILHSSGYVTSVEQMGFFVTVPGILAIEKIAAAGGGFIQGFVAMWFDREMDDAWINGFEPAIKDAGYQARRIDKKEYVGGITDEIISEIRRSRFVVVDYTEQANGVYFEAGFALGLGLPVIPTCRKDQIDRLHFDVRHLNTLPWGTPQELAVGLCKRIVTVIGAGPEVRPKAAP
jgi:hypothetical protein